MSGFNTKSDSSVGLNKGMVLRPRGNPMFVNTSRDRLEIDPAWPHKPKRQARYLLPQ